MKAPLIQHEVQDTVHCSEVQGTVYRCEVQYADESDIIMYGLEFEWNMELQVPTMSCPSILLQSVYYYRMPVLCEPLSVFGK